MKKALKHGEEPWFALLEWRNTPTTNDGFSPTQKLFSRHTRSSLPIKDSLLEPQIVENVPHKIGKKRQ